MKRGQVTHHLIVVPGSLGMNGLSMLSQIVKSGELLATVAGEWSFTSMFSIREDRDRQVQVSEAQMDPSFRT
jgi:hypothetical protein